MTVDLNTGPDNTEFDFDLDIRMVETGNRLEELMRLTDDGCGATCASACNSCP